VTIFLLPILFPAVKNCIDTFWCWSHTKLKWAKKMQTMHVVVVPFYNFLASMQFVLCQGPVTICLLPSILFAGVKQFFCFQVSYLRS